MQPSDADIRVFARLADASAREGFVAGELHPSEQAEPNVFTVGRWTSEPIVSEWDQALYDHSIIDPEGDYLSE